MDFNKARFRTLFLINDHALKMKKQYSNAYTTRFVCLTATYVILFILLYGAEVDVFRGDDLAFCKLPLNWATLKERYFGWTSRLIIETLLLFFSKHALIFRVFNSVIMLSLPLLLNYCLRFTQWKTSLALSIVMYSLYDILPMESAGIRATYINYFWPLAALLSAQALLQTYLAQPRTFHVLVAIPMLTFACNNEQCCLIAFIGYGLAALFCLIHRHKAAGICLVFTFVATFELLFIVTCPGNYARIAVATQICLPPFIYFDTFSKMYLGITSTINRYFFTLQWPILVLLCIFPLILFARQKYRTAMLMLIPLCVTLVTGIYQVYPLHTEDIVTHIDWKKIPIQGFVADEYCQFWTLSFYARPENGGMTRKQIFADLPRLAEEQRTAMDKAGISPFEHYIRYGGNALINPSNSFDTLAYIKAQKRALEKAEGQPWTMDKVAQYIAKTGMTPLEHCHYFTGIGASDALFPVAEELRVSPAQVEKDNFLKDFFFVTAMKDLPPTLWSLGMSVIIVINLWYVTGNRYEFAIILGLLTVGFCSRIMLGFSPTIYASADRTFIFFDFALIGVCTILSKHLGNFGTCLLCLYSIIHTTEQLIRFNS